jgi:HlyD family secretion protein
MAGGVALSRIDFRTERVALSNLTIETVQQGTMEVKVGGDGQLLSKSIEQIGAQVTGRVAKIQVKAGDAVKVGQVLVQLTNPQVVAASEEAYSAWQGAVSDQRASEAELNTNVLNQEGVLTQAQFNLERARLQLQAEQKLDGQHVIPDIDFAKTKLNVAQLIKMQEIEQRLLETVRANVKVRLAVKRSYVTELERALERARNQVANLQVVAGIDGIVQAIGVDVGQQLEPGSLIGRIARPDQLYAELRVAARDAAQIRVGQSAVIDTHGGIVMGSVTRVDPAVSNGTVIIDVDPTGELPAGARPQLPVEGTIYTRRIPNTLFIGRPAYVRTDSDISVYKLDSLGRYATRVTIKAGQLSLNYMQVLQGLKAGDRIITSDAGAWQDKNRILID